MTNNVKKFIVEGFLIKKKQKFPFKKEIIAVKQEDAIEKSGACCFSYFRW